MAAIFDIVIVGGCGHVGLPLGIVLATRGVAQVTLLDVDGNKVERVNSGHMPFMETGAEKLLRSVIGRQLRATLDTACLRTADIVITVIGTPVDEHLNPTVTGLFENVDRLLVSLLLTKSWQTDRENYFSLVIRKATCFST